MKISGGLTQIIGDLRKVAVTLRQLLEAGVHFGHRTCFREPKMAPYIYGVRNGINIIDLEKTKFCLTEALHFITKVASVPGSKILFVGTKRVARGFIKEQAIRCGMPYVNHRWLGGLLTNYRTIRQSVKQLKELEAQSQNDGFQCLTKKESLNLQRHLDKLERGLGGVKDMLGLPDVLFVIDRGYEHNAISEAKKLKIPVVSIVDSNHSPEGIDYVIPGNDDAARAVSLYTRIVADTILEARPPIASSTGDSTVSETGRVDLSSSVQKDAIAEFSHSTDKKGE